MGDGNPLDRREKPLVLQEAVFGSHLALSEQSSPQYHQAHSPGKPERDHVGQCCLMHQYFNISFTEEFNGYHAYALNPSWVP